jgi:hypothetical protein
MGNTRPQEEQISWPSAMLPLFRAGAPISTRSGAPHPTHLNHSRDLKFIPSSDSLHQIRRMATVSRTPRTGESEFTIRVAMPYAAAIAVRKTLFISTTILNNIFLYSVNLIRDCPSFLTHRLQIEKL